MGKSGRHLDEVQGCSDRRETRRLKEKDAVRSKYTGEGVVIEEENMSNFLFPITLGK